MRFSIILLAPIFAASYVSAHGRIASCSNAAGRKFSINPDNNKPDNSPIRRSPEQNPIYDLNDPGLTCGVGAKAGALSMEVQPGDIVSVEWRTLADGGWPHNTGPMMTYLSDCGGPCPNFNHENARFFKISQKGKKKPPSQGWFQADIFNGAGPATFQIPKNLAPGNYLARHEIIALHLLPNKNHQPDKGAEFYPGCIQLKVGGNQKGRPDERDLLKFPGAYKATDPGITDTLEPFTNAEYIFPGGRIAPLNEGGSPPSSDDSSNTDPTLTPTPTSSLKSSGNLLAEPPSTSLPAPSKTPKSCKKNSSPSSSVAVNFESDPTDTSSPTPTTTDGYERRRLGHIMRRRAENEMGLH